MIRTFNPDGMTAPASNYSQGAVVSGPARWLYVSGQLGIDADGATGTDYAEQMELAFQNVFRVLSAAGMAKRDLVKVTVLVTQTDPDAIRIYRETRDRLFEGHKPAATYMAVAGLAAPEFLVEIEAVAAAA